MYPGSNGTFWRGHTDALLKYSNLMYERVLAIWVWIGPDTMILLAKIYFSNKKQAHTWKKHELRHPTIGHHLGICNSAILHPGSVPVP